MDVVSTAEVPAQERFAFWREVSSTTWVPYDARCPPQLRQRFQAQIAYRQLDLVQATLMTTTPYAIRRTPRLIRQTDPEIYKLGCTVQGHGVVAHDDHQAVFGPGDLVLYDTSRPYRAELAPDAPTSQMLVLKFPRSSLPLPSRDLRRLSMVPISGAHGIGALTSQFMLQIARRLDELTPSDTARLAALTLDVLTAALAGALDADGSVPPESRRRALLAEIHAFILAHLGDTRLSPETIAAAHHISLRSLHQLFHTGGHTVAGWIRERRLERCRRDLADPRLATRTITAIAARWGFTSPAHFSQTFRSAYSLSPRQFRHQSAILHED
ncbi:AraC family transcriptional regulator [Planobispora rosea]|uniref:AraC family transcriptional regulator n=1 Tax=Planobispora rosea TaxID=35762 RepID=A0A8J3WCE6_PLARO|nr:helix-turn-helix domain-containing protein [Planobispora rosea]GGS60818.1 AraC family transcriptional regulator [Planobispora rosea]GIH83958.1 AraC family transcriptional regulator [Planobispora rosea]